MGAQVQDLVPLLGELGRQFGPDAAEAGQQLRGPAGGGSAGPRPDGSTSLGPTAAPDRPGAGA